MVDMVFYEKPGCRNNTLQKKMLKAAGHELEVRDLLTHSWSRQELFLFLGGLPLAQWFNRSAPAITSGDVDPDDMGADEALSAMVADPLLIRRPLMQVGDERKAGFDIGDVHRWVGLRAEDVGPKDVESCSRKPNQQACP